MVTVVWMPLDLPGVMYIIEYEVGGDMIRKNITDGTTTLTVSSLQPDTVYEFVISSYKDGKRSLPARIRVRTTVAGILYIHKHRLKQVDVVILLKTRRCADIYVGVYPILLQF